MDVSSLLATSLIRPRRNLRVRNLSRICKSHNNENILTLFMEALVVAVVVVVQRRCMPHTSADLSFKVNFPLFYHSSILLCYHIIMVVPCVLRIKCCELAAVHKFLHERGRWDLTVEESNLLGAQTCTCLSKVNVGQKPKVFTSLHSWAPAPSQTCQPVCLSSSQCAVWPCVSTECSPPFISLSLCMCHSRISYHLFQFFCLSVHYKGLFMLVHCDGNPGAMLGTTPNIKHIVMGRCYTYITLVNPGLR